LKAGILLETIISQSNETKTYVLSLGRTLNILGFMIIRGSEDLKLVTATIVGALVQQEQKYFSLFWPEGSLHSKMLSSFPLMNSGSKEWFHRLASFVDEIHSQSEQGDTKYVPCKLISPHSS
jgi:hypothetical protein